MKVFKFLEIKTKSKKLFYYEQITEAVFTIIMIWTKWSGDAEHRETIITSLLSYEKHDGQHLKKRLSPNQIIYIFYMCELVHSTVTHSRLQRLQWIWLYDSDLRKFP